MDPGTVETTSPLPARTQAPPGEAEMRALAAAYPDVIGDVELRDGDWALELRGTWYFWADGRLLPDELREEADEFVPLRFYNYHLGPMTSLRKLEPTVEERLRERTRQITSSTDPGLRFNDFLDTLYGVSSLREAEEMMVSYEFLDRWIRVHPFLTEPLERVERRIRSHADLDVVQEYLSSIGSIHAYNWRNIAGTQRRSYHSYGVALDLVPRAYQGRWAYWLWAAESGVDEWWKVSIGDRLPIPDFVLDAFELEGFVWGGKWLFFDNLHFEYRPESLILARGEEN